MTARSNGPEVSPSLTARRVFSAPCRHLTAVCPGHDAAVPSAVSPPMMEGCSLPCRYKMPIPTVDQGSLQYEHAGATSAIILASWPAIATSTKRDSWLAGQRVRLGFAGTSARGPAHTGRVDGLRREERCLVEARRQRDPVSSISACVSSSENLQMPHIDLFAGGLGGKAIYPTHTTCVTCFPNTGCILLRLPGGTCRRVRVHQRPGKNEQWG